MSALNTSFSSLIPFNFELNYNLFTIEIIRGFSLFSSSDSERTRSIYRDVNLRIASKFRIGAADAAMHKTNFYFHWNQGSNSILSMEEMDSNKTNRRWRCEVTRNWGNKQPKCMWWKTQRKSTRLSQPIIEFLLSFPPFPETILSHTSSLTVSNPSSFLSATFRMGYVQLQPNIR